MLLKSVRTTPACLNTGKSPAGVQNGLFVLFWGGNTSKPTLILITPLTTKRTKTKRSKQTTVEHLSEGRPREFGKG